MKIKEEIKKIIQNIFMLIKQYRYMLIFFFSFLIAYFAYLKIDNMLDKTLAYKFETIQDLKKYAEFYPEKYKVENNEWADPVFTSFYKNTLRQSFINKILVKLGIKKDPIFNAQEFKNLLEKVTRERIGNKLLSPFNKKLELKRGDRCIIFGDLHASFHSLVRDLVELEKQKILDNNLKIKTPNTYFVVLGDTINRAPYSLETLNVLLMLLEKNQENMTCLKGNHEADGHWRNYNTRRQIQIVFPKLADLDLKDNLFDKIDNFFITLPNALVIEIKERDSGYIICSNAEKPKLYENKKNVKFMIVGEKRFDVLKDTAGLEFVGYDYGVAKWSFISCPNVVYENFFNFQRDTFVELSIGQSANNCVLTLNSHNIHEKEPVFKQTFYDPVFGYEIKSKNPVLHKNVVHLGSTMPLSGILAPAAKENKIGLETAIFFNNKYKKNLVIPVILDDGYSPRNAISNVNILLNTYRLNTILAPMGTPTLASYIDLVKEGKLFVFFPYTGSEAFRNRDIKNIIHFRAGYKREATTGVNYLLREQGIKDFAFFYQNDSYGKPISEFAQDVLKKAYVTAGIDLPHQKMQSNFQNSVEKLKITMPEAIGCFSTQAPTQEFIDELGSDFFSGKIIFGVTFLFSDAFKKFLDDRGISCIISRVVPDVHTSDLEIVKEFRQNMTARGLKISSNALEGYISGALVCEAINKMQPPFTGEKIIKYFESMKNFNFKGLILNFNPEFRSLEQPLWLVTQDGKWLTYKYEKDTL